MQQRTYFSICPSWQGVRRSVGQRSVMQTPTSRVHITWTKRTARFPCPMNPRHMSNSQSVSICNQWQKEAPIAPMWSGTPEISCLVCPRLWGCLNTSKSRGGSFLKCIRTPAAKGIGICPNHSSWFATFALREIAGSDNFFGVPSPLPQAVPWINPCGDIDAISSLSASVHFVSPNSSHTALSPHLPPSPLGPPASFRPLHLGLTEENHALGSSLLSFRLVPQTIQYLRVSKSFDVFQEASIRFNQH